MESRYIALEGLEKRFDGLDRPAVASLTIRIASGAVMGLVGPDGAGKTTLMRILAGLLKPSAGRVSVVGLDPLRQDRQLHAILGYMPQKFGLYEDLTVMENLNLYASLRGVIGAERQRTFERLLAFTSLAPFTDRLAGKLSGGMKQKLGLACTLIGSPQVLLLDEPGVGVDPISRRELWRMVHSLADDGMLILWSTSYLDEAEQCREVLLLNADPAQTVIEAQALTKKFGSFAATDHVDFQVRRGEIFGLLGPNGAGKSTTFKMMCGLLVPTSGHALVLDMDLKTDSGRARQHLGYMAQKFSLYGNLTVAQNLTFFSGVYGLRGRRQRAKIADMTRAFNFTPILSQTPDALPLGFKQRLALACALMHEPDILFLDEPTSGVDPLTRREFWLHINGMVDKGVTVMVTTHFMDEAEYCDRIALVYHGQIIASGSPDDLKARIAGDENPNPTMEQAFIGLVQAYDREHTHA